MSAVSSELRKYFEKVKNDYAAEIIQEGEFTMTTFQEETGLRDSAAREALVQAVKDGTISVRWGRNKKNIPCQLYKVVK